MTLILKGLERQVLVVLSTKIKNKYILIVKKLVLEINMEKGTHIIDKNFGY